MSKSARLRLSDLRSVHTIVGECRDLGDDSVAWRSRLALGLGQLVRSVYAGALEASFRGGTITPLGAGECGDVDWKRLQQARVECGANLRFSPLIDRYLARREPTDGAALCCGDLVGQREWRTSRYYHIIHEPFQFGHNLVSFRSLPDGSGLCNGVLLARTATERRDFTAREKAIAGEFNAAIAPLIGGPLARTTEPSPSDLSPRVRDVLRCLLEGDSDKQIASRLRISSHTVNVHTKTIYRHFVVQSRPELLARWIRRGWGGRCAWADPE